MTKKEGYFVLFFILGYALAFFAPLLLVSQFDFPTEILNISAALLYILFAIGSFSIASIPLFVRSRLKLKGRLTHALNVTLFISGIALFVVFGAYAFITFLLPLVTDVNLVCRETCPCPATCWAGIPMNRTLFDVLMISNAFLSGLTFPFFLLWVSDAIKSIKRLKRVHPQPEV